MNEVEDLVELHFALDAGLGSLRSEIAAVRSSVKRDADSQADCDDRLDTILRASLAPRGDQGRGRRRRKDEPSQRESTAATDELLREYREIRSQVATLSQMSEGTTTAVARASSMAADLGPLRGEVSVLRGELAEQQKALGAIRASVARPRPPAPAALAPEPAPAAPAPAAPPPAKKRASKAAAPAAAAGRQEAGLEGGCTRRRRRPPRSGPRRRLHPPRLGRRRRSGP